MLGYRWSQVLVSRGIAAGRNASLELVIISQARVAATHWMRARRLSTTSNVYVDIPAVRYPVVAWRLLVAVVSRSCVLTIECACRWLYRELHLGVNALTGSVLASLSALTSLTYVRVPLTLWNMHDSGHGDRFPLFNALQIPGLELQRV